MQFDGPKLVKSVVLANILKSAERDFNFEQLVVFDMKSFDEKVNGRRPLMI